MALNAGTTATAVYAGGSGSNILTFNYVVAAGDAASPLDYTSTSALTLNGGTIEDAAGDVASLILPAPGCQDDGLARLSITIDTAAPNGAVQTAGAPAATAFQIAGCPTAISGKATDEALLHPALLPSNSGDTPAGLDDCGLAASSAQASQTLDLLATALAWQRRA